MSGNKDPKEITRRGFMKGAAIGAGAISMAGLSVKGIDAAPPPKKWGKEADIVVIGAGGAGLLAAIQAHDAGARVMVLEKLTSVYASSTAISGGGYAAADTEAQKKQGISDSTQKFYEDMMKYGAYMNNAVLLKLLTDNATTVFNWLLANGLPLLHVEPFGGHSVLRFHRTKGYSGKDYVDTAWKVFQNKKIPISFNTAVGRLYYDQAKQAVVGVEAKKGGKAFSVKAARAVIIACGGFCGDAATFDKWIPAYAGSGVLIGGGGCAGDGIKMATKDAGGFCTHLEYSATYPMGVEVEGRKGPICRYYYFFPLGAILVNKEGKRYVNEETPPTMITYELAKQTGKSHYLIIDSAMWEEAFKRRKPNELFGLPPWSMEDIQDELKKERVLMKAESVAELAKKAGIDAANLENTVSSYNGYVKAGDDPAFKRTKKSMTGEIAKPPFYAVKMTFWTCLTLGGSRVNEKLQVLDPYDAVINRLYAAGETVGGVHGANYLGGCAMAWAHTSGFLAGKNAAAEKPWGK